MQNQTDEKHSSNSVDIFKSNKNILEKLNTKEDSSNTATSKVLSKRTFKATIQLFHG